MKEKVKLIENNALKVMDKSHISVVSSNYSKELEQEYSLSYYINNIFQLAVPNTITHSAWVIQSLIGIYYVGLLDDIKLLDGISLGYSWVSVFGYSIILGFSSALDTFVTQFYGSGDFKACGRMLNKSFVIVLVMCIPCLMMQCISGTVFNLMGIDHEVSMYSFRVALTLTPSIAIYVPLILVEKFLMGQQITKPQMAIQLINTVLYPLYCHICVFWFGWGLYGVVVVRAFSEAIYVAALVVYMKVSHCCDESLVTPTMDVFKGWNEYLSVAWPSLFMTVLEWWGFEILNLLCGKIGPIDLAANVIGVNFINFIYLFCTGIGTSSGTLVGNSIGEGNIKNAKRYIWVGIGMTLATMGLMDIGLLVFRSSLSRVFSREPEVVEIVGNIICMIAIQVLSDGTQATQTKILIAMGRQSQATWVSLFSYYVIMLPLGILGSFYWGWRVYGIWFSTIVATFFVTMGYNYLLCTEKWIDIKKEALSENIDST